MGPLAFVALDAFVKGAMYLGAVLLVGVGLARHVLIPAVAGELRRPLRVAALAGAGLVLVFSVLNVALVLRSTLGYLEADLVIDYARSSLHGRATQARSALALLLVVATFLPRRRWVGALWGLGAAGLLYSFSAISHNASMPGRLPVLADWTHLTAAVAWSGAVFGVAFLPVWSAERREVLERAMVRVSRIGLVSVVVLFATGVYSAQLHVWEVSSLVATRYGWTLVTKVGLVLAILGIAALNRWRFLPALQRHGPTAAFERALRVEALLLLAVLATTGVLTTSPVPH